MAKLKLDPSEIILKKLDDSLNLSRCGVHVVSSEPGIRGAFWTKPEIRFPSDLADFDEFLLRYGDSQHLLCTPTVEEWEDLLKRCQDGAWCAFDIETKHNRIYTADNPVIGFSVACGNDSYYIPVHAPGIVTEEMERRGERWMIDFITTVPRFICQFGFMFDIPLLAHRYPELIRPEEIGYAGDLAILAHVVTGAAMKGKGGYGLGNLANKFCGAMEWKGGPKQWLAANIKRVEDRTYDKVPPHVMFPYARRDAYWTLKTHEYLMAIALEQGLDDFYDFVIRRVAGLCIQLSMDGFPTSKFMIEHLHDLYLKKAGEAEVAMKEIVDARVPGSSALLNLNSPDQISVLLYDTLGLPVLARTEKKNAPKTGTKEIMKLSAFDPPLFAPFFTFKKWIKYHGYLKNYVKFSGQRRGDHESPDRYVCHPIISPVGTDSGRTSSSKPNEQNISVGSGLKTCFCAHDKAALEQELYDEMVALGMPDTFQEEFFPRKKARPSKKSKKLVVVAEPELDLPEDPLSEMSADEDEDSDLGVDGGGKLSDVG